MWNQSSPDRAIVEWLLGPVSIDDFARKYYEKAPLHIPRNREGFYDRFFSLSELERVVYHTDIANDDLYAAKDGTVSRKESYLRKVDPKSKAADTKLVIDSDRVSALFAHGCSIVVDKITTRSPGMAGLCSAISTFFRLGAGANVYLTPGGEQQGFRAHYDTHDAVIIQIEGTKHWRVYDWGTELALQTQNFNPKKHVVGEPKLELEMRPGDLLYLPRGVIHEARSSDALSLHVTIGLYPITWIDVLWETIENAGEELALRRSASVDVPANFEDPELVAALARALSSEKIKAAEQKLRDAFLSERSNDLAGQLRQIALLRTLDEHSWISIRPHMVYVLEDGDETKLSFSRKTVKLQRGAAQIVRALQSAEPICVADLIAAEPKAVEIVRQLIAEGFAVQREAEPKGRGRQSLRAVEDLAS